MAFLGKTSNVLRKLRRDESGITSISWTLSIAVILGAMGAAMDIAVLSSADIRSQAIADNTALSAAIYVKNNGRPPTEEGELTDGTHTAASLGYDYKSFVKGGADGVDVTINYDDNAKEVTTTVTGKTNPILVKLLNVDELKFSATSVVSYLDVDNKFPASIALVLDNSGSMQFDDRLPKRIENVPHYYSCNEYYWQWSSRRRRYVRRSRTITCQTTHRHGVKDDGAKIRLDGLKSSVVNFQNELKARLGTEDESERRTIRMGMLPYSSSIDEDREIPMNWGYLPEGDANTPRSIEGMIADGGTNSNPPMAEARTWLLAENNAHSTEATRTQSQDKDPLKFVIFMTDGQNTVGQYGIEEGPTGQWHQQNSDGTWSSQNSSESGYIEGTLILLTDSQTVNSCNAMKGPQENVTIFTIGYALEDAGEYRVNGWAGNHDDELYNVPETVRGAAYNLMTSCASSPEHFIQAANADELEAAFDEIQNAIIEELIRLKS